MLKPHELNALICRALPTRPTNFFTCDTTSLTPAEWDLRMVADTRSDYRTAIAVGLGLA